MLRHAEEAGGLVVVKLRKGGRRITLNCDKVAPAPLSQAACQQPYSLTGYARKGFLASL